MDIVLTQKLIISNVFELPSKFPHFLHIMNVVLFLLLVISYLTNLIIARSHSHASTGCKCESPNVRTVLFKPSHITKECWNQEEIALLYARRLMQEILPRRIPNNMDLLVSYIKMCLKILQDEVSSRYAHSILLLAMADALGGYLQAYGLPICKGKFYEGTVNYCVTKQVNELLDTTKRVLGTDGGSWTRPVFVSHSPKIAPYVVPNPSAENSCNNLITNYDLIPCHAGQKKPSIHVPLPFLDSGTNPAAVALPFRNRSLFSLMSKDSCDIFLIYYTVALHCLYRPAEDNPAVMPAYGKHKDNPNVQQFDVDFHNWLVTVVLPHLHDEKWYPGFGSVLRLLETMSKKGIKSAPPCPDSSFSMTIAEKDECKQTSIWFYILCVLIFLLLFWLCVCCICACARVCKKSSSSTLCTCSTTSSSGRVVNTLLSLYEGSQKNKSSTGYKSMGSTQTKPRSSSSMDSGRFRHDHCGRYKK